MLVWLENSLKIAWFPNKPVFGISYDASRGSRAFHADNRPLKACANMLDVAASLDSRVSLLNHLRSSRGSC